MRVHFIGIGGIGVSSLARYYLTRGALVTGSDLASSEITADLEKQGVKIALGRHKKTNLPRNTDLVIYTAAATPTNPELKEARKRGAILQSYAEAIGQLTQSRKTITVSGSHGKSTTTALAALILEEGYFDPTVIIGTKLKEFGNSNFRRGHGPYLVLEADEYNKTFLHFSPYIAIVTNIDAEHLDTYRDVLAIQDTFEKYLEKVPPEGHMILNRDDGRLRTIGRRFHKQVTWYSLESPAAKTVRTILKIPGEHNLSNALAALALGRHLGIQESAILKALSQYEGAWRRFEFKGLLHGAYLYTDYAHHPTEIKATIAAARQRFPLRRIWCIFQPHQYQRLAYLWDKFIRAFELADQICILPVYEVAGRETKRARTSVNSEKLTHALVACGKDAYHVSSLSEAKRFIRNRVRPGDVVLLVGAGDVYTLANSVA